MTGSFVYLVFTFQAEIQFCLASPASRALGCVYLDTILLICRKTPSPGTSDAKKHCWGAGGRRACVDRRSAWSGHKSTRVSELKLCLQESFTSGER